MKEYLRICWTLQEWSQNPGRGSNTWALTQGSRDTKAERFQHVCGLGETKQSHRPVPPLEGKLLNQEDLAIDSTLARVIGF